MIDLEDARYRWHPIAASTDLVPRHVFHAQILGREMALWRADDGNVNAWENRCLHRGVRLSIGVNDGTELVCQYHGWRYANRTAGCTYIPAHPADAPARSICNNTYLAREKYGLIWSGESPEGPIPDLGALCNAAMTPLRAIVVNTSQHDIALSLINRYNRDGSDQQSVRYGADTPDPYLILLRAYPDQQVQQVQQGHQDHQNRKNYQDNSKSIKSTSNFNSTGALPTPDIAFFLQPLDAARTAIRGLLCGVDESNTDPATLTALLRQHDFTLSCLRDDIEKRNRQVPAPEPWIPNIPTVSETNALMPELTSSGRQAPLRLRIAAIKSLTNNVKTFRLETMDSPQQQANALATLPAAQAGAHIDVHLPNGLVRQYSLINGPGQTDHYAIAVKRLADSTGGSIALHDTIKVGDVLATSIARNNFSLRRDAEHTHLIAGGIGLTPLLSMARALDHARLPFTLHHFIASDADRLFQEELDAMHAQVYVHTGQDVEQTQASLSALLQSPAEYHHIYLCGPGPMLSYARKVADELGWPDASVHFEYFKNTQTVTDASAFSVELARSGLSLEVPAGESLLNVLRAHDVDVPSSCEQGACGTCRVAVLEGEPEHQDVYLSDAEKARGDCLMSCVSRARSARLVLDI